MRKTYLIWVSGQPLQLILNTLRNEILLYGKMIIPATIEVMKAINQKNLLKLIIKEGHNRQTWKTAPIIGYQVKDLQRIAISNIKLDGLQEGKCR